MTGKCEANLLNRPNHRRQRTPRVRPACILRQRRGAAAADRSAGATPSHIDKSNPVV
jgi:hypothetical protein